ncbi:transposase [Methylomusa anaerophila]|uniref:transposase n=1 Tax=Methylomusa anaerophila TaxID=1930071 RepID=UPI002D1FB104|nr:transposase [Methylomusa anaerophila]
MSREGKNNNKYSAEFKMEAVKRLEASSAAVARVAAELGINENTLHGWLKKYRDTPIVQIYK